MLDVLHWRTAVILFGRSQHVYRMPAVVLLESLPYHSVDLVVLDPPSLIGAGTSDNDLDTQIDEHVAALVPVADQVTRVLKPGGVSVIVGDAAVLSAWELTASWVGLRLAGDIVVLRDETTDSVDREYAKELSARRQSALLKPSHSPSLFTTVRWHVKPGYRLTFDSTTSVMQDTNVLICRPVPMIARHAVTQRPVELFNYLISLLTQKKAVVVDPFCGTGSALVAARMCERRWVGCDISQEQCVIARRRVARVEIEQAYLQPLEGWNRGKRIRIEG